MNKKTNAPMAAQKSSHSTPDVEEQSQDTSAFEPEQTDGETRTWEIEDSEMGPGTIETEVKGSPDHSMVYLTMRWISGQEQPEVWEIQWCHMADYLLDELPQYLLGFCPVGPEMIEVLNKLGLEKFPKPDEEEV
jgi:hypothetical protein